MFTRVWALEQQEAKTIVDANNNFFTNLMDQVDRLDDYTRTWIEHLMNRVKFLEATPAKQKNMKDAAEAKKSRGLSPEIKKMMNMK